jgi:hypothetical protein
MRINVAVRDLQVGDELVGSHRKVVFCGLVGAGVRPYQYTVVTRRGDRTFTGHWNGSTTMSVSRDDFDLDAAVEEVEEYGLPRLIGG